MTDPKALYQERLGRYQSAMALLPTDRVPICPGPTVAGYTYGGLSYQEVSYEPSKLAATLRRFHTDFPEIDTYGPPANYYAPYYDSVENNAYKYPGRDLPPDVHFQYIERENMKEDEYEAFIADPSRFLLEVWMPRVFDAMADRTSPRYAMGLLKAIYGQARMRADMGAIGSMLANELGLPMAYANGCHAAFDELSDKLRDFKGIIRDMRRRPEAIKRACQVMNPFEINKALAGDPARISPPYLTTHKPMFMSNKEFDEFYWPTLKEMIETVWDCGVRIRILLEGDWTRHLERLVEVPRTSLLVEIDMQIDPVRAKEVLGGHHCLVGGLTDPDLILSTPTELDEKVHFLCETVGKGGGYILGGPGGIPGGTPPENIRAMCEAVNKYGWYDRTIKHQALAPPEKRREWEPLVYTPFEDYKKRLGGITGNEAPIAKYWNAIEAQALGWVWSWL